MKLINNLYFYPEKGMLDSNTYVITGNPGIIIDVGSPQFLPELIEDMRKDGINPKDIGIIANTHLHLDHCGANEAFKELSGGRIIIHPLQKEFYNVAVIETTEFFGLQPVHFKEDACFDNSRLNNGDMELELVPAPGHSPDSICFYSEKDKVLICGDVIFDQNTGRADLPGGNAAKLRQTIEALSKLEIEYLLPGHMGIVTGSGKVKRNFGYIEEHILRWL